MQIKNLFLVYLCTLVYVTFIATGFYGTAKAHHGGEGIGGQGLAGPIITIPAYTLPKGRKSITLQTNYTKYNTFSTSKLRELAKRNEDIDDPSHLLSPNLGFNYGLTDNLSFGLNIPYIFRFGIDSAHDKHIYKEGNAIGIGDLNLFSSYRFYKNENKGLYLAFLSGLKIPTGVRRDKNRQGERFHGDLQPSNGSWEPQTGIAASKRLGNFSLDSNFLYQFGTSGVHNTILGDIASYNVALSYGLSKDKHFTNKMFFEHFLDKELSWDLILEANGQWAEKPKIGGVREENDGGTLIYLSPGIRLVVDHKWVTNLSVGFPIIEDINGRGRPPHIRLILGFTRAL